MRTRKWMACALLVGTVLSTTPGRAAGTDGLMQGSRFCDSQAQFRPGAAVLDGPSSQLAVHREVLEPAFAAACPIGSGLVTYLGTGEHAGIDAMLLRRSDRAVGTANVSMTPIELAQADLDLVSPTRRARTVRIEQIPLFLSVEAVVFNLSSCKVDALNLRSSVLSAIYSGVVTKWNDRLLTADNPALAACDHRIHVIKRGDYAGSTLTFKDYLSKRNPEWNYYKQASQNQSWPTVTNDCPALDDDGVADCISTTSDSIGYIDFHTARLRLLRTAALDNVASEANPLPGQMFVHPSPGGCTIAAASSVVAPSVRRQDVGIYSSPGLASTEADWSTVSITDAPQGYPMCSFAYAFIYGAIQAAYYPYFYSPHAARTAVDYLWTALSDPVQAQLTGYDFGRLPANVIDISRAGVEFVRFAS